MTVGERIKNRREKLGLSVEEVARKLNKHRATVYRYESNEIETLPIDVLEPLAVVLRTSPAYLMGWEDQGALPANVSGMPETHSVPRLGAIACGEPVLAEGNIEGYDAVPDWVQCDFTLVCRGESMTGARIYDGDIVCIRRAEEVRNGQIAAVLVEGEFESEATLKRFYKNGDTITLLAENPAFPPFTFSGEEMNRVRVIGLATHFISTVK